jgi:uncharacterized protein VirK/YbjX
MQRDRFQQNFELTENLRGLKPPTLVVENNKFFSSFQAPRFIYGVNPKSLHPKSKID